jgi:hypothetical protein
MAEVATGKTAGPFNALAAMVLNHSTEEGMAAAEGSGGGAKSLVDNFRSMLPKPKAKAA